MGLAFLKAHIHLREVWLQSKNVSSGRTEKVVRISRFWVGKQHWPPFKLRDRTDNLLCTGKW